MPSFVDPPSGGKGPIRPPLRLIHPAPPPRPKVKRRRHEGRVFTREEQAKLRAAIANAARAFGGLSKLADAMGVHVNTLATAKAGRRYGVSAALAVRLARVAGVSLDDILRPLRVVSPPPPPTPDGAA